MIDHQKKEKHILWGLAKWFADEWKGDKISIVRGNQTGERMPYPFVSFNVIGLRTPKGGTNIVLPDGTFARHIEQTWSWTVQSDDDDDSKNIALLMADWFDLAGNAYLADHGIVARQVGNITNRDVVLGDYYEYRQGFDVIFTLVSRVDKTQAELSGEIETVKLQY